LSKQASFGGQKWYSSASDYDEQTLALLAADDAGSEEPPDE